MKWYQEQVVLEPPCTHYGVSYSTMLSVYASLVLSSSITTLHGLPLPVSLECYTLKVHGRGLTYPPQVTAPPRVETS